MPNFDVVSTEFLYYTICSPSVQKELNRNASGSTFKEISASKLKKITIAVPTLKEQRQIVAFLSDLDNKISCAQQKVSHLQLLKKGLMQQMFV